MNLEKDIREYLKTSYKTRKPNHLSPSSFGNCIRRQVWELRGIKQHPPKDILKQQRAMRMGTAIGDEFQRWMKEVYGSRAQFEVVVEKPEYNIRGRVDAVVDGELYEIKSANSFSYKNIIANPTGDHYFNRQLHYYPWAAGKDFIYLVVIAKDSATVKQLKIPIDWGIVTDIIDEATEINWYLNNDEDPPIKNCKREWCPFEMICYD